MKLEDLISLTAGIPHTTAEKGSILYNTIIDRQYSACLELGFAHGVGTAYIGAALAARGEGRLTSVDLSIAESRIPSAEEVLERTGVRSRVDLIFHPISYNWYLMDCIREGRRFDFCFIDGAHTWEIDGLAFYLVNECLVPGGMIIFDDLDWSFEKSPSLRNKPHILKKPEFERKLCQVREVFELLVKRHPDYPGAFEKDGWAYALKRAQ